MTTGAIAGTVSDGVTHTPLANVAVTAEDEGSDTLGSATTGSDGTFKLVVPAGPAVMTFALADYTSPSPLQTGVGIGETVHIAVAMSESASGVPSVSLAATGDDLGYGTSVPLTATASSPLGNTLTYTWTDTDDPALGTVSGSGSAGTLVLPTMAQAFAFRVDPANPGGFISGYTIESRFGVLPILTDTRGQVTAMVTVADGHGQSASASITLNAASVNTGTANVNIGKRVYMNSGHGGTSAWTLSVPTDSVAALDNATVQTPSFVPDLAGQYTLAEGANSITIYAGTWRGMITGGSGDAITVDPECTLCHQNPSLPYILDEFTPWEGTGHATMFTRGINGEFGPDYGPACIGCHTVGDDPGVTGAGGFDQVAASNHWTFPASLIETNWTNMVALAEPVAQLANVQCENCHGPQNSNAHMLTLVGGQTVQPFSSPRISYSAEACGICHAGGDHHEYSEWNTIDSAGMSHSNLADAQSLGAGASGLNSSCGRCHTAQGYTLYADQLGSGNVTLGTVPASTLALVTADNVEAQTCTACHDPHDATNPNQLRFYDTTPNLPGGFAGYGMGKGAICLTCHNSRNGSQNNSNSLTYLHEDTETYNGGNPTSFSAPHQADQGDVFEGHNAYFLGSQTPMLSRHAAITDTCAGCHMTLQPETGLEFGAPTPLGHEFRIVDADVQKLCSNCHGANVNGAGIQASVSAQLAQVNGKLGTAVIAKVAAVGGTINVAAYDDASGDYSSPNGAQANVQINTTTNPIVSASLEEVHGQIAVLFTLTTAITIPYVTGTGSPAPKTTTTFAVQLGSLKDNSSPTPLAMYTLAGAFVRAGWNYFLISGDQSLGLHNPSFVTAVLDATLAANVTN